MRKSLNNGKCEFSEQIQKEYAHRMLFRFLCLLVLSFFLMGCRSAPSSEVMYFTKQDAEMNAAIRQAQDTLDDFIGHLQKPQPTQKGFSIKARFPYDADNNYEHIWLVDVSYTGVVFKGRIGNDRLFYVKDLKYGDVVTIAREDVSDWMFVEDGKLVGGFTFRVIWNRMSPQEREELGKTLWFEMGD